LGQSWLKDLKSGEYRHETYIAHLDIPGDDAVALLSDQRLALMQLRKMKLIWDVPLSEMQSLSLEDGGIGLVLRGGQSGPFLPISDRTGRDWLFKNIGK
jgi:vacuolar protein sorting-associated protein 13A/C